MNKSIAVSLVAVLIALVGAAIAMVAYLNRKKCVICDDFEDDIMSDNPNDIEYFATDVEDDMCTEDCCECDGRCFCEDPEEGDLDQEPEEK